MTNVFMGVSSKVLSTRKLVRNGIGLKVLASPKEQYKVSRCKNYFERRRGAALKVLEEAQEVVLADIHESDDEVAKEAADVLEALYALLAVRGISLEKVEQARLTKKAALGDFSEWFLLRKD